MKRSPPISLRLLLAFGLGMGWGSGLTAAEDWPQFRGPNRDNSWNAAGISPGLSEGNPTLLWRAPIGPGFSSPIVAGPSVFVTDLEIADAGSRTRLLSFDRETGKVQWSAFLSATPAPLENSENPAGPCPTPIADDDGQVFALASTGELACFDVEDGEPVWRRNLDAAYDLIEQPNLTACPLIEAGLLIVVIGGRPGACVVALEKDTGAEAWRALDDPPRAFSSPIVIEAGGQRQLIVWTPSGVTSLDPASGRTWWREELATREDFAAATPVYDPEHRHLLVSGLMFQLDSERPGARILWPEKRTLAARVLSNTCMPALLGHQVYGADMNGRLRCLDADSGELHWETGGLTGDQRYGSLHLFPAGEDVFLFTDEGNLIRARLGRDGYREIDRFPLIEPTFLIGGRRVAWAPPAFAGRMVFARSDRELICAEFAVAKP